MTELVICCPEYRANLSFQEELNLRISECNNSEIEKYFILPDYISIEYYNSNFPNWKIIQIDGIHFQSIVSYNKLMLSNLIYKLFSKFEYILICQSDAVLVKNVSKLPLIYDYIGAPWKNKIRYKGINLSVGNGGLSLRKSYIFYNITTYLWFLKYLSANEDVIFALLGKLKFIKTPTFEMANVVFKESTSSELPMIDDSFGFHALEKWNSNLQNQINKKFINSFNF